MLLEAAGPLCSHFVLLSFVPTIWEGECQRPDKVDPPSCSEAKTRSPQLWPVADGRGRAGSHLGSQAVSSGGV